tara:strand:- start:242 stop:1951 length:1710 start_codon:yes stop_codon:yes gene_type:complete
MTYKNNKPSNKLLFNSKKISKTLKSEFKDKKLMESFKDIKMFNEIKLLADNSKIDLDLSLYGLNVAIPAIKTFVDLKEGIDLEQIKKIHKESSMRTLFITNQKEQTNSHGINALDITYEALTNSFSWSINFEEFINSKELKITKWTNPIEQLILCITIAKIFNCYFDLDHYVKAAATILFMDDRVLKKFSIKRAAFKDDQYSYLEKNLITKAGKSFLSGLTDSKEYKFKTNKGYPYLKNFAKWLPNEIDHHFNKSIEIYSSQTKKDFITKFKQANSPLKLLMIIFNKKDIPINVQSGFSKIYRNFKCKKTLDIELKNISYEQFELAILNFLQITKSVNLNTNGIKTLFQKGLLKELINYKKDHPGAIIQKALGYIPVNNRFIKGTIEYGDYEVKQVYSRQELIAVGEEFQNCLRTYQTYHTALRKYGHCFLVFRLKSRKKNFGSFVAYLDISNKNCNIFEMLRKRNHNCSHAERFFLQELLMSLKLIDIPDEFFAHYTMKTFTEIASKDLENGINNLIEHAPIIYALLKRLKKSKSWFYNIDNQILTEEIKGIVADYLQEQNGMKSLAG